MLPALLEGTQSAILNVFLITLDHGGLGMRVLLPPRLSSVRWRMSHTPQERLREYLGQLPPNAQALLMREFERAIERGQDVAVATLVLDQLRKVVRPAAPEPRVWVVVSCLLVGCLFVVLLCWLFCL